MTPTNYDMAIECLATAERRAPSGGGVTVAHIEAMAAQTYATLALVDAVRGQNGQSGGSYVLATYHAALSPKQALSQRVSRVEETFDSEADARSSRDITGHLGRDIYRVSVEVVQA